jgi:hypothetical protein
MMLDLSLRRFLGLLGAPAIVRASSLMPIGVPRKSYLQTVIDEYGNVVWPNAWERATPDEIFADIQRTYLSLLSPTAYVESDGYILNHGNAVNYELLEPQ